MAKYKTRRFIGDVLHIVGRSFEDVSQEIQEWAGKITRQVEGGIPAGFNNTTPNTIQAGVSGDPGLESDGWMAAGATIPVETGIPSGLGNANDEGSGTALMRAGATIKRDVRVKLNGSDVATRNALDLRTSLEVDWEVVDNPAADTVEVSARDRLATPGPFDPSPDPGVPGGSGGFTFGAGEGAGFPSTDNLIFYARAGAAVGQGGW